MTTIWTTSKQAYREFLPFADFWLTLSSFCILLRIFLALRLTSASSSSQCCKYPGVSLVTRVILSRIFTLTDLSEIVPSRSADFSSVSAICRATAASIRASTNSSRNCERVALSNTSRAYFDFIRAVAIPISPITIRTSLCGFRCFVRLPFDSYCTFTIN